MDREIEMPAEGNLGVAGQVDRIAAAAEKSGA
jgi:hypothetical protein